MSKVITFSRTFPAYHPKAGQPTRFREKILHSLLKQGKMDLKSPYIKGVELNLDALCNGTKNHTIRAGNRWKVGDWFSPREWSGKPYNSPQTIIAPDTQICKVWEFEFMLDGYGSNDQGSTWFYAAKVNGVRFEYNDLKPLFENDGLSSEDALEWFSQKPYFNGQIICWNENINY